MADNDRRSILITENSPLLSELKLSWSTAVFAAVDGIGPMDSLHQAGDALVAVAKLEEDGPTMIGSGVMVGPGLLLTATHVLDEFPKSGVAPVFLTFLPGVARAWLPQEVVTTSGVSKFDERRKVVSDLSLVSCTLNSDAHADLPLMLAPMQIALPLIGERLWAMGFRHQGIDGHAGLVTPFISSGLVTAAFPNGRGERMASSCFEVDMGTIGGMSGGAVVNSQGYLVGIVSSSFDSGPSYITLIWDALRLRVKGTIPKLAGNETVSLLGAAALGLAKLKGDVVSDPWQNVTIRFSDEEVKLYTDSIPASELEASRKVGWSDDQLDQFMDTWGREMEDLVCKAAIEALGSFSLSKAREFLEGSDVPTECLEAIESFSVKEFDGVEDLWITSTDELGDAQLRIEYYFDIRTLLWSVQVEDIFFQANKVKFLERFINEGTEDGITTLMTVQRRYFKGSLVFDQNQELFSEVSITSSAMSRRRSKPKQYLNE